MSHTSEWRQWHFRALPVGGWKCRFRASCPGSGSCTWPAIHSPVKRDGRKVRPVQVLVRGPRKRKAQAKSSEGLLALGSRAGCSPAWPWSPSPGTSPKEASALVRRRPASRLLMLGSVEERKIPSSPAAVLVVSGSAVSSDVPSLRAQPSGPWVPPREPRGGS